IPFLIESTFFPVHDEIYHRELNLTHARSEVRVTMDDPQLTKSNAYAKALQSIVYGQVTEASSKRRQILRTAGPDIERAIRKIAGNEQIHIALIPAGSTLKGYATDSSDLEYIIIIL